MVPSLDNPVTSSSQQTLPTQGLTPMDVGLPPLSTVSQRGTTLQAPDNARYTGTGSCVTLPHFKVKGMCV